MRSRLIHLFLLLVVLLLTTGVPAAAAAAPARGDRPTTAVWVDTDTGVDDAVALAALLRAPAARLTGISTVMGNTTVEHATRNVLTVLDVAGRTDIPVVLGADRPLVVPFTRTGLGVHGPDGLWFAQRPHDLAAVPRDVPAAIAAAARATPGMTVLALGPLTNIAAAVQRFPQEMASVTVVALVGGTRGNRTPVAEMNAFVDPQALQTVLHARLNLTLITLDAFESVTVPPEAIAALGRLADPLAQLLAPPLAAYAQAETQGAGGPVAIPDLVAAVYVLRPQIGAPQSALVEVMTDTGLTRGQTIIGLTPSQKLSMIADDAELSALADRMFTDPTFDLAAAMGAILARQPDNAQVVLRVKDGGALRDLARSFSGQR